MVARHCLLVVDDEPDVVHSLQDLLRFDYRVLGATRVDEGLKLLEREEVHIVMTDQRMPEMTGVEFLQRLRDRYPDVVRLLFTGYADIHAVIDAINQGNVFRYVTKPWDTGELQAVLRQAAGYYDLVAERKNLLVEVWEQNRRLEIVNTELRQANDLKVAFIKVASHELRTPLTIMLGLSELAYMHGDASPDLKSWIEQIHQGSKRLGRLIDQIVQMLLSGTFERPLARTEVALADLIQQAAADVAPFLAQRRQRLDIHVPDDLGTLAVEPDKLRDSLTHLLLNAVKFTPDGGVLRIEGRRLPDGATEVRVSDTGIGIDAASLKHVFEPFFTGFDVSRHTSGVFEFRRRGLGMGLALVKAFVEMHGGQVNVESQLDRGSVFAITLPAFVPAAGAREP